MPSIRPRAPPRTNDIVTGLDSAADRIGEVVKLINDIAASRTNLLALNATIGAARAGEDGKGFAVVANEVLSLVSQTGKATEDISQQVGAMQNAAKEAAAAIQSIGLPLVRSARFPFDRPYRRGTGGSVPGDCPQRRTGCRRRSRPLGQPGAVRGR